MSPENKDILFEKRDTNTPAINILLIWMIVFVSIVSLLMIPLTKYLWEITAQPVAPHLETLSTPAVVLEVIPSQELKKRNAEVAESQANEKVDHALKAMLEKGFQVKS